MTYEIERCHQWTKIYTLVRRETAKINGTITFFSILVLDLAQLDELDKFIQLHMDSGIDYPQLGENVLLHYLWNSSHCITSAGVVY